MNNLIYELAKDSALDVLTADNGLKTKDDVIEYLGYLGTLLFKEIEKNNE